EHGRVDDATGRPAHVVGTDAIEKGFRVGTLDANLAEGRLVENRRMVVRLPHLGRNLIEPGWFAERELRFAGAAEEQRTLPAIELAEMRACRLPSRVEHGWPQMPRRAPLTAGVADLIMLAQHLGCARGQGFDAVQAFRESCGIGLAQVARRVTVHDAVRE